MEVTSYGGDKTESSGLVRIIKDLSASIADEDVLLVEDIIDTGLTLDYLVRYLRGKNPASLKICTLLDKPARRPVDIPVTTSASRSRTSSSSATGSTSGSGTGTCASSGVLRPEVYHRGRLIAGVPWAMAVRLALIGAIVLDVGCLLRLGTRSAATAACPSSRCGPSTNGRRGVPGGARDARADRPAVRRATVPRRRPVPLVRDPGGRGAGGHAVLQRRARRAGRPAAAARTATGCRSSARSSSAAPRTTSWRRRAADGAQGAGVAEGEAVGSTGAGGVDPGSTTGWLRPIEPSQRT